MISADTFQFAFGNLKHQLGLIEEPSFPLDVQQQLQLAAVNDNHVWVSETLKQKHQGIFSITVTHDVDWLDPYHPFAWIQSTRTIFNNRPRIEYKQLWKRDLFLRNCERLLQTEQQLNIQSIWCLGAQATKGLGRYDIRYSANNPLLKELITLIQQYNQEIGLHSSYSAIETGTLQQETNVLSKLTGQQIKYHRSHYLNGDPYSRYELLDQCGILTELGMGYARKIALKGGIPGLYHPYNSTQQNMYAVSVLPLILMDNIFFVAPKADVFQQLTPLLKTIRSYEGAACMLFHPENFILKPQLWETFHEIIHICKQEEATLSIPNPLL